MATYVLVLGERSHLLSPAIDLELHSNDVVQLLQFEDPHDVILVGHSYGGMVVTGVADRAADRVGRLAYLDAAYPKNGRSLVAGAGITWTRDLGKVVGGVELVLWPTPEDEDALWAIPQFHIVCEQTLPTRDHALLDKARSENRLWSIDTGHDLMITEPQKVADVLREIAAR